MSCGNHLLASDGCKAMISGMSRLSQGAPDMTANTFAPATIGLERLSINPSYNSDQAEQHLVAGAYGASQVSPMRTTKRQRMQLMYPDHRLWSLLTDGQHRSIPSSNPFKRLDGQLRYSEFLSPLEPF